MDCTTDRCSEGTCTNAPDGTQCTESDGGRSEAITGCHYGGSSHARTFGPQLVSSDLELISGRPG